MKLLRYATLFLLLAAGCSAPLSNFNVSPAQIKAVSCVAVLPFQNSSHNSNAGKIVSDIVSIKVMGIGDFSVMTRPDVQDILSARGILFKNGIPVSDAPAIGKILGVQAVFAGVVTSYPSTESSGGNGNDPVGLKLYFIDVSSGNVLWTGKGDFSQASPPDQETIPYATVAQDGVTQLLDQFHSNVNNSSGASDVVCWNDPDQILSRLVIDRHAAETAPAVQAGVPAAATGVQAANVPPANVSIINASGIPRLEIKMGILLVKNKYNVSNVISGKKRMNKTTIFYKQKYYNQAVAIAKLLHIQPEFVQSDSYNWDITLFIGKDMK
ncbi:MAG: LytR C-terminal domain-containing protein [Deltaproteobacteria bacterium]|nr:LytR C-terminal domain-containing protein [Deltaproteobacteria bacterium]